jgi:hypothetical protein
MHPNQVSLIGSNRRLQSGHYVFPTSYPQTGFGISRGSYPDSQFVDKKKETIQVNHEELVENRGKSTIKLLPYSYFVIFVPVKKK